MTSEGFSRLQEDLKILINKERPEIIAAIAEARGHGDLSENAEYQYAKEQQSLIEGKISELESIIANAEIAETILPNTLSKDFLLKSNLSFFALILIVFIIVPPRDKFLFN